MKIVEKFYAITGEPTKGDVSNLSYGITNLTVEQQKQVEELVKEYLGFEKVEWMELPAGLIIREDGTSKAIVAKTRLVGDEPNTEDFKGKTCYLYTVVYTPEIYDPSEIGKPVKDGMSILPVMYDPKDNFSPYKQLSIQWRPEDLYDEKGIEVLNWDVQKDYLREKLEQLLANPDDYIIQSRRGLMVRYAVDTTEEIK